MAYGGPFGDPAQGDPSDPETGNQGFLKKVFVKTENFLSRVFMKIYSPCELSTNGPHGIKQLTVSSAPGQEVWISPRKCRIFPCDQVLFRMPGTFFLSSK